MLVDPRVMNLGCRMNAPGMITLDLQIDIEKNNMQEAGVEPLTSHTCNALTPFAPATGPLGYL